MSNVGISFSLQTQTESPLSPAEQLLVDIKQLAMDIKSGDLPATQQDYVTLSQDLVTTEPSASASAAEAGVIVSLLSDLLSLPFGPPEDPRQFVPSAAGFDYARPLFTPGSAPQNSTSSMDLAATNFTLSASDRSASQPGASSVVPATVVAVNPQPAQAIARPVQAGEIAVLNNTAAQQASTPGSSTSSQESLVAAAALAGSSSNSVNQLIPGINPDSLAVLPWNLFDWQLSNDRSRIVPPVLLRKRKNPRGSAARTRAKRRKP